MGQEGSVGEFTAVVRTNGSKVNKSLEITIPRRMARHMKLNPGQTVLVKMKVLLEGSD
ncbi:Uncharacterised protein [uncultured archaeon]|nr:Uncharacterised protein [uncultured archaeon]